MPKYTFTKKNAAGEEFRAEGCDSFDEAIRKVEKGIAVRDAELAERDKKERDAAFVQKTKEEVRPPAAPAKEIPPVKPDMVEAYDEHGNVIPPAAPVPTGAAAA